KVEFPTRKPAHPCADGCSPPGRHPRTRCLLCRCTARQSRKPLRVSFVRAVDRWLIQRKGSTGKKSLYHAPARHDKQLREMYAGCGSFTTGGGMDRKRWEGRYLKLR